MPKLTMENKISIKQIVPNVKFLRKLLIPIERCDHLFTKSTQNTTFENDKEPMQNDNSAIQDDSYDSTASMSFGDVVNEPSDQTILIDSMDCSTELVKQAEFTLHNSMDFEQSGQESSNYLNNEEVDINSNQIVEAITSINLKGVTSAKQESSNNTRPKIIADFPIGTTSAIVHIENVEDVLLHSPIEDGMNYSVNRHEHEAKTIEEKTNALFEKAYGFNNYDDSENEGSEWELDSVIESSDEDSEYDQDCDEKEGDSLTRNNVQLENMEIETIRDNDETTQLLDFSGLSISSPLSQKTQSSLFNSSLVNQENNLINSNQPKQQAIFSEADQPVPTLENNFETLNNVFIEFAKKRKTAKEKKKEKENQNLKRLKKIPRKRKWHICAICKKDQSHLKRHMMGVHKTHPDVMRMDKEIKVVGKGSRKPMKNLLYRGDKALNEALIAGEFSQFIVRENPGKAILRTARKPTLKSSVIADYVTCPDCSAFFKGKDYRAHFKRCTNLTAPNLRSIVQLGRRTFYHCHPDASEQLKLRIFSTMRNDKVIRAIRYDRLIIKHGNDMCLRLRNKKDNNNIKTQLRRLGRLKLLLKVKYLADALNPDYSEEVVSMIEKMASDPNNPEILLHPTVAQNVAGLIKTLTAKLIYICIRDRNADLQLIAENFLKNFTEDYYHRLSHHAGGAIKENKRHQEDEIPSQEDIQKLLSHLRQIRKKNYGILTEKFDKEAYFELLKATLTSLQVYNRRRPGDVERITLDDYNYIKEVNSKTSRAFASLPEKLQDVAKEYSLLYTTGKLGKDVKLLVSREIRLCIDILILYRDKIDINPHNVYLFALERTAEQKNQLILEKLKVNEKRKESMNHPSAYNLLYKFARSCGASRPELLRCNLLRHQMATECQNLNLDDAALNDLAGFMSHDVRIHKSVYRKDIVAREIPILINFINTANGLDDDVSKIDENSNVADQSSCLESTFNSEKSDSLDKSFVPDGIEDINLSTNCLMDTRKNHQVPTTSGNKKTKKNEKEKAGMTVKRVGWLETERSIAKKCFSDYLAWKTNTVTNVEIDNMLNKNPNTFTNRNHESIRSWLHAQRKKNKKE